MELQYFESLSIKDQEEYLEYNLPEHALEWSTLGPERKSALLASIAHVMPYEICWNYVQSGITPYLHFETLDPMYEESPVHFSDVLNKYLNYKTITFGPETHAVEGNRFRIRGSDSIYYCCLSHLPECNQCRMRPAGSLSYHLILLNPDVAGLQLARGIMPEIAYPVRHDELQLVESQIASCRNLVASIVSIRDLVDIIDNYRDGIVDVHLRD